MPASALSSEALKPFKPVQPCLKWAGGKRQLLPEIRKRMPRRFARYFEPFMGGGAVLFDLQPKVAFVNDANAELINLYRVIQHSPQELIEAANRHPHSESHFYALRALDRGPGFASLSPIERAARLLFLNKTCYNGLFRVNSQGHFNAPFGHYAKPTVADPIVIQAISGYLNDACITLSSVDFAEAVATAAKDDFVYLDPPYDPVCDTSFTGYSAGSFPRAEQLRLKELCDALTQRRCHVLQSNSDTDFIRELYSDASRYSIIQVEAARNINSVASGRGKVSELLITNLPTADHV